MTAISFVNRDLRNHLREPVIRSGYALIASSFVSSALGAAYWLVAARKYDAPSVGIGSSLVAAMTLLTGVANLGFKNGLLRFVPTAGRDTRSLVLRAYALTSASAVLAGGVFLWGLNIWSSRLHFLRDNFLTVSLFIGTMVAWSVFTLQDSVLVGLGRAGWVPIENTVFSLAKIAALIALVTFSSQWGIFLSWSVPTVVLVIVVSVVIMRRLIPRYAVARPSAERTAFPDVVRFSLADHIGSLLWLATIDGLPLLVLGRSGPSSAAYYYLAAQIAYGLYVLSGCIGAALVAEAGRDRAGLPELSHRAMRQAMRLVLPATVVVIVVAPLLLRIFGTEYERNATTLLRLLALSAVPYTVTSICLSRARVRTAMRTVIGGQLALFVACVGLSLALEDRFGLMGVGVAVLIGQSAVAAWFVLSPVLLNPRSWVSRLTAIATDTFARSRRTRASIGLEERLAGLGLPLTDGAQVRLLSATNGVSVASLGGLNDGPAIIKFARRRKSINSLTGHMRTLRALASDPALDPVSHALPRVVAEGVHDGSRYVVETVVPGTSPDSNADPTHRRATFQTVGRFMAAIHAPGAHRVDVDDERFVRWVRSPLQMAQAAAARWGRPRTANALLLEAELREALDSGSLVVTRIHGDLTPGNLLMNDAGTEVTGLVDWECSTGEGLPGLDAAMFVLATRRERTGDELGRIVLDLANGGALDEDEAALFESTVYGRRAPSIRHLVLLAWLAHLKSNLTKCHRYANNPRWLRRNVLDVLGGLSFPEPSVPEVPAVPEVRSVTDESETGGPAQLLHAFVAPHRSVPAALWVVLATAIWFGGLERAEPGSMNDFGLVSIVHPLAWLTVVGIAALFIYSLTRAVLNERRLGILLAGFIVMIHGAAPVAYGTLRYSWAWKHIGIVDYIGRTGTVQPDIGALDVYHNWPGFFSANAALVDLVGVKNAIVFATWAPVAANLLSMMALLVLLPALIPDRRIVWTATWLFFLANWVGQDYFSPQAMAYFLYLIIMAILLGRFRKGSEVPRPARLLTGVALVGLMMTVISIHQVTPALMILVIFLLTLTRRFRGAWLVPVAVVGQGLWLLGPAKTFTAKQMRSLLESFGTPVENAGVALSRSRINGVGQAMVTLAGRGIVVFMALLALVGLVTRLRSGKRDLIGALLMVAPLLLVGANEFGGEILFRAFLFSVPFLALYTAAALMPATTARPGGLRTGALITISVLLFSGFVLAHFGKDRYYHFSKEEVAASTFLAQNAVSPTLLVEGSGDYPSRFLDYERFVYVPIALEAPADILSIANDPAGRLSGWLSDDTYKRAYIVITRSQKFDVAAQGLVPPDTLDRIEDGLRSSPKFRIAFQNGDAVIFALAETGESQ